MSWKNRTFLPCVVLMLLICKTLGQDLPPSELFLPIIDLENFQLTPTEKGYTLSVTLPNGSRRDEVVELINPGTPGEYLAVRGTNIQIFEGAADKTSYTADNNGYLAKYRYASASQGFASIPEIGSLALRAAAG